MLDLKLLQKNPEVVAAALAKRHSPLNMRTFEELDNKRRDLARRKPLILQNFPSQQIPQRIRPHKKAVQISRWNLQNSPVKHRVDIIGSALKGTHRLNPLL